MADQRKPRRMDLNRMCDGCHGNAPQVYCECTGKRIYLCDKCISGHIVKHTDLRHELIPAEIEVSNMSAYRERGEALIAGKRELEENLMKIDQCCEELTTAVEYIIWVLTEYLSNQLSQLHVLKTTLIADITQSVNEAQSALALDTVQFSHKYSQYLRHYEKDCLVLFDFEINPNLAGYCLQYMPSFSLLGPGQYRKQLVRVNTDKIETFNFETETWNRPIQLSRTIEIGQFSIYTQVDTNLIFICGNKSGSVESMSHVDCLIDFISGNVEQLPPLSVARSGPGVLHHEGEIFVFGCNFHTAYIPFSTPRRELEMLQLAARKWTRLPDMPNPRCFFTPCLHLGIAYLCYAKDTQIDRLELRTRKFLNSLPITIPEEQYWAAVTLISGDELIVITSNHITTFDLLRPASISQNITYLKVEPISVPVKYGDRVYWMNNDNKCIRASGNKLNVLTILGK